MTRLSTSRPKRSVPRGCSRSPPSIQSGGISFWVMSPSVGLWGARDDEKTAVSTSRTRTDPANQGSSRLRPGMTYPRIEIAVEEVDQQVASQIEPAQHEHAGLYDRGVARGDRLEDEAPQAGPREDGLGDHGAAQELHEEHDREGDDRQQRVLQTMLPEHHLLVQALEPRELDVVRAQHLEHGRARQSQDGRRGEVTEREGRKDDVLDATAATGRQEP